MENIIAGGIVLVSILGILICVIIALTTPLMDKDELKAYEFNKHLKHKKVLLKKTNTLTKEKNLITAESLNDLANSEVILEGLKTQSLFIFDVKKVLTNDLSMNAVIGRVVSLELTAEGLFANIEINDKYYNNELIMIASEYVKLDPASLYPKIIKYNFEAFIA